MTTSETKTCSAAPRTIQKSGNNLAAATISNTIGRIVIICILAGSVLLAICGSWIIEVLGFAPPDKSLGLPYSPGYDGGLGLDYLGRSVASRLLAGGQELLILPVIAALITEICALIVGLGLAVSPRVRPTVRFLLDVIMVSPAIVIMLIIFSAAPNSAIGVVLGAAFISLPGASRYIEANARPLLSFGYVEYARSVGTWTPMLLAREIVPNLIRQILADLGLRYVSSVYLLATAAFLGVTQEVGGINWAIQINASLSGIGENFFAVLAPGLAIASLTIPVNLIGDWIGERV